MTIHPDLPNFLASEISNPLPENALFHILPVPYEKSVSYGTGTAKGPMAILESSLQLELFDGISIPAEHGIYTHPPIDCNGSAVIVLQRISDVVSGVLGLGKIPVLLGGEHTVSAGAFSALKKTDKNFGIVQFDAHADLRDTYEGTPHSHACVMHRALDMGIPIYQIGVRSLSYEEHLLRNRLRIGHLDTAAINETGIPKHILPPDFPDSIYITFDVDAFDPSVMPATGTPEPGGLSWYQAFQALKSVISDHKVIGFDVVELSPIAGIHAPEFTIARFIYNLFGIITRRMDGLAKDSGWQAE
jgi:agmatinase